MWLNADSCCVVLVASAAIVSLCQGMQLQVADHGCALCLGFTFLPEGANQHNDISYNPPSKHRLRSGRALVPGMAGCGLLAAIELLRKALDCRDKLEAALTKAAATGVN